MRIISRLLSALAANLPTLLFLIGFVWLYVGVAGWSQPAANVTAGGLLIALAAFPYLRRRKD